MFLKNSLFRSILILVFFLTLSGCGKGDSSTHDGSFASDDSDSFSTVSEEEDSGKNGKDVPVVDGGSESEGESEDDSSDSVDDGEAGDGSDSQNEDNSFDFPQDILDRAFETVSVENLKRDLTYIASDELEGRLPGSEGSRKAQDYIVKQFEECGVAPAGQDYLQNFVAKESYEAANIVGIVEGSDPLLKNEFIVIGGHYDHLGKTGNEIFNGADDNGSGTVGVVATACALSKIRDNLGRSIIFVAFDGEEMGLLGSKYYVENALRPLEKTVYMLNLDMIGRMDAGRVRAMKDFHHPVPEIYMADAGQRQGIEVDPIMFSFGGSDHMPFWSNSIPAVFFNTGVHEDYHKGTDTVEKINFEGMAGIIKITVEIAARVSVNPEVVSSKTRGKQFFMPEKILDHGIAPFLD